MVPIGTRIPPAGPAEEVEIGRLLTEASGAKGTTKDGELPRGKQQLTAVILGGDRSWSQDCPLPHEGSSSSQGQGIPLGQAEKT